MWSNDSKGAQLNIPDYCPPNRNRMIYPLKVPLYNGIRDDTNPGEDRVVYSWERGNYAADGKLIPHPIWSNDSKETKLNFPDHCPPDRNRMECPLKVSVYNGGKNNKKPGKDRVVYYWKKGDFAEDGKSIPHPIWSNDSKGQHLNIPDHCPPDENRMKYPLKDPVYKGAKNNIKPGEDRVVYSWKEEDFAGDGKPIVYYGGVITHKGAPKGGFRLC